jgi:hypothetical protein
MTHAESELVQLLFAVGLLIVILVAAGNAALEWLE